jgi:hypothetical protein
VRAELSDLVHRYAALVDDRDFAAAAALFTPHGVLVRPEPPDVLDPVEEVKGRPAIEQALRTLEGVGLTIHAIGGEVYDGPTGRIVCVAHHLLDPRTDLVWHLRYRDRYEQDGDRWLIGRRELSIDLIETRAVKRSRGSS